MYFAYLLPFIHLFVTIAGDLPEKAVDYETPVDTDYYHYEINLRNDLEEINRKNKPNRNIKPKIDEKINTNKRAQDSKDDIDSKISSIKYIFGALMGNAMYEYNIGYKTYGNFADMYEHINNHRVSWDALKFFNAYEKVKRANDYVSRMLRGLEDEGRNQKRSTSVKDLSANSNSKKPLFDDSGISWSYYDDDI